MGAQPIAADVEDSVRCTLAPRASTSSSLQLPHTSSVARVALLGPTRDGSQSDCIEAIVMPSSSDFSAGAHSMHQKSAPRGLSVVSGGAIAPPDVGEPAALPAAAAAVPAAVAAIVTPFLFFK